MNKYARIDKYVTKGDIYRNLYFRHSMLPSRIANRFGVKVETVVRAIKKERTVFGHELSPYDLSVRINRLAWAYSE